MTVFRESVSALIALLLTVPVLAQTSAPAAPGKSFDVVSVKVNQSGGQTNINVMPTGVTLTNIALRPVIQRAAGGNGRCAPQAGGPGHMILVGSRLSRLAGLLAMNVGRTVVDKTGLAGAYDMELRHAPNQGNAVNEDLPSIFAAVQEQLGLTLKPATESQDVLVIDRVERPEPN